MRKYLTLALLCVFLFSLLVTGGCAQEMGVVQDSITDARPWAEALQTATAAVAEELTDDYAAYFTPEEFRLMMEDYEGSFAGIGIYMTENELGEVYVVSVMPDRPAMAAGLEMGDIITHVDGESMEGLTSEDVQLRIRGDAGTDVVLTLRRDTEVGSESYTVTVTRAIIESSSVEAQMLEGQPGIAYFYIYDFTQKTPQEFQQLYNQMVEQGQEIKGLILDLRSNGGGSFYAAINLADYFVPRGEPIVWEKSYGGEICHRAGSTAGALTALPVVCLMNGDTASASEVFIGALKDYGVATLVGTTSFGKGITQILEELPNNGGLRYTQSRYYTPLKYDLHQKGLEPDRLVENEENITYDEYFDPNNPKNLHIEVALEVLAERLQSNSPAPIE